MKKPLFAFLTIFFLFFLFFHSLSFESINVEELEAVFIYKFLSFVYWPQKKEDISLCIIDNTPLKDYLLEFNGYPLQEKTIIVKDIKKSNLKKKIEICDVLILDNSIKNIKDILSYSKERKILTISNNHDFIKKGGMLEIFIKNKKLRFKVNYSLAKSLGIRISSKVLSLAEEVL